MSFNNEIFDKHKQKAINEFNGWHSTIQSTKKNDPKIIRTCIEHILKALVVKHFNVTEFDKKSLQILQNKGFCNKFPSWFKYENFGTFTCRLLLFNNGFLDQYYNNIVSNLTKVGNEDIHGLIEQNPDKNSFIEFVDWFFKNTCSEPNWNDKYVKPHFDTLKQNLAEEIGKEIISKLKDRTKIKPNTNSKILQVFIGLILISLALVIYLLIKSKEKTQKGDLPIVIAPPKSKDSTTVKSSDDTPQTGITSSPVENERENRFKEGEISAPSPKEDTAHIIVSNYIQNDDFKNKESTIEMAVLIVNDGKSINGDLSQKVSSVFLKSMGYINTASLLSGQFVTSGLFDNVFSGSGSEFAKKKYNDFVDYFCLGKSTIETVQSDVSPDMIKATIDLELKIIKSSNGAILDQLTIPAPYNIGAGFSKRQAIETATNNIINFLKNYKYEN